MSEQAATEPTANGHVIRQIKPWEVLAAQNRERLQRLATQGAQIGGLGDAWMERLWRALLGDDRFDEIHLEHEQWLAALLTQQEQAIAAAIARAKLLAP